MRSAAPADVLNQAALERDRCSQEQRVQGRAVEAVADVRAGRDDEQRLVTRPEPVQGLATVPCLHPAAQPADLQAHQPQQMQRLQSLASNSARTGRIETSNASRPTRSHKRVAPGRASDADHLDVGRPAQVIQQVVEDCFLMRSDPVSPV